MSDKNIYQRINAVMSECDYLQKKQMQQGKGIRYDEVIAMIRGLLIKHGIVMETNQESLESLGAVEGSKQKVYQGKYSLTLVNMDKPDEKVVHTSYAQGMDGGDKGAGKAHTYAFKQMLVKGFGIETGEDEESRSEKIEASTFATAEQIKEIKDLIRATNSDKDKFLAHIKVSSLDDLSVSGAANAIKILKKKEASNG